MKGWQIEKLAVSRLSVPLGPLLPALVSFVFSPPGESKWGLHRDGGRFCAQLTACLLPCFDFIAGVMCMPKRAKDLKPKARQDACCPPGPPKEYEEVCRIHKIVSPAFVQGRSISKIRVKRVTPKHKSEKSSRKIVDLSCLDLN